MATILVIDDEHLIRTLLSTALQSSGHEVVEACSGREGVHLYRERPADLVIVDMLMPELNGLDTILELTREFLNVKVVAMSGVSGKHSLINTAKLLGARQIILKPFAVKDMLNMVQYELAH